jgi:hypothetical protein
MRQRTLSPRSRSHPKQRGAVLAEFVFVAPFILALAGYGLRFGQELQARELAMAMSNEISTEVFSKCMDITIQQKAPTCASGICVDTAATVAAIQGCMKNVAQKYKTAWTGLALSTKGDLDITVETYRYNIGSFAVDSGATCDQQVTRLQTRITSSGDDDDEDGDDDGTESCDQTSVEGVLNSAIPDQVVCKQNRMARAVFQFTIKPFSTLIPGASSAKRTITNETTL